MATITQTSQRITISGAYKDFTGDSGSTSTVIQFASGDAPASGDAGRFLLWKVTAGQTGTWQIRYIESATSTTVTVGDGGFASSPPVGATFAISTNLDDVVSAVAGATSVGTAYSFDSRDFSLAAGAFLADTDKSLSVAAKQTGGGFISTFPCANGCAVQFGRLNGGEANDSTETTNGCQLSFEVNNNTLMFTNQGSVNANGPIINFYGCLIESISVGGGSPFIRSPGPMRIIGCLCDGPMGGRLYSSASELVDTRFSGNTSGTVAWSLGGTFTRPISNAFFFQNNTAVKAYLGFQGVFKDTTFADSNTNIINSDGATSSLVFTFLDCTTFADGKISANKGRFEQAKSINYTVADSNGTGLSGVLVAAYNTDGTIQQGVKTSSSGSVDTINACFFLKTHGNSAVSKAPFDIRIRKYGYVLQGFQSAVSEPIKQEVRLPANSELVSTEVQAAAISGISLNFATSTLTITSNTTAQQLYDYYQYQLAQSANMAYAEQFVKTGTAFNIAAWDMTVDGATYTGDITTTGTITLANGGVIDGTRTDASGTVFPPQPISITNISAGSRLQIYNVTTATETVNQVVAGTSYSSSYTEGADYTDGDTVRVRLTKLGKEEWVGNVIDTSNGFSVLAEQVDSSVYSALGVDGSTITKFAADYTQNDVNLVIATDWTMAELYAWWAYNLTTEDGIRNFFGGITAIDQSNFRINTAVVNLYLDNNTSASFKQTDNRRFFRDSGDGYPIKSPTTSGYGLDAVWRSTILIAETETSGLTASESSQLSAVSGNLTTINNGVKKASLLIPHTDNL